MCLTICQHNLPANRTCSIHSCCVLGILHCWHSLLLGLGPLKQNSYLVVGLLNVLPTQQVSFKELILFNSLL